MNFYAVKKQNGFTLIEVLLVVALIAILAGIVILAINPSKQVADTNNTQRRADVNTILNAVYQYAIDSNGELPSGIPTAACNSSSTNEICRTNGTCTGIVDLSVLTTDQKYLVSMPIDPISSTTQGTGYWIGKTSSNNVERVTVCAPGAENGETISVTR